MERLIQLIMENIIYIVIVVGVISSILSKVKGTPQQGQGQGMPPFGKAPTESERRPKETPAQHERRGTTVNASSRKSADAQRDRSKHVIAHEITTPRLNSTSGAASTSRPIIDRAISDEVSPIYQPLISSGDIREQARKGNAWSEILGPPRAMKRHSRHR